MDTYLNYSLMHLQAELDRVEVLLKAYINCVLEFTSTENPYPTIQITPQEVSELLEQKTLLSRWLDVKLNDDKLHTELSSVCDSINHVRNQSLIENIPLRLDILSQAFNLSTVEIDILLLALAPVLDSRYAKFFAYLQNDLNKTQPTIELICDILSIELGDKFFLCNYLNYDAALYRYELLLSRDEEKTSLFQKSLSVSERIINYLLNNDTVDIALMNHIAEATSQVSLEELILPAGLQERFGSLLTQNSTTFFASNIIYFQGCQGAGKRTLAQALSKTFGVKLLVIKLHTFMQKNLEYFINLLPLIFREAILQNAILYWEGWELLLVKDKEPWLLQLQSYLEKYEEITLIGSEKPWQGAQRILGKPLTLIEFSHLTAQQQHQLWQKALPDVTKDLLCEVANRFKMTPGQIFAVASQLHQQCIEQQLMLEEITPSMLYQACRDQAHHQLSHLARHIIPVYNEADIVLPRETQQQLNEIINYVKSHAIVYEQWGFAKKLSSNKGLNALFSGPPGTGKTMAAEVIAASLGLDLYKIDLSLIVSKYIGETEKNLSQIFNEAKNSNAILFFDEADALFGKRSEVQDSHDRYANLETSYLLQQIEDFSGIVILATNFKRNLDDAFIRRLHFVVDFAIPNVIERLCIWQQIWPEHVPLSNQIDLQKLAQKLELAGGNIRNVALTAAFRACQRTEDKSVAQITCEDLIYAAQREYRKMGKMICEEDFTNLFA